MRGPGPGIPARPRRLLRDGRSPRGGRSPWDGRSLRGARSLRDDRGQVAVEFTAMAPIILATLIVLWQAVLIGYTFVLAGDAADRAVHAGAEADPWKDRDAACASAGEQDLSPAWRSGAGIGCTVDGGLVRAHADLKVPLLFPGFVDMPITVPGNAAAARES
ncbi:TadE/TadG family type IV pilus assembly protein [Streptomyces sp. TS71-3]|uniref:TadE/TadG family type IV pilus assembly protein n=1 Tax=Streptomyces sp. TS71-3 TaxID=2733862 RepID=UPI001B176EE4|nr:pilus assembly protein [Streptomyces sp. TS71-3]GHJ35348.1 septum formation initiator [Streptomyces sp. TS71-3]